MTFTYTIQSGIKWSDGVPLTAKDVAYTLNLYKNNHAYLPQNYLTLIDGDVAATDDDARSCSTRPSRPAFTRARSPYLYDYILPEHIFAKYREAEAVRERPQRRQRAVHHLRVQGRRVRARWSATRSGPAREPRVDELIYRIYKNEDALAEALKTGEVDFGVLRLREHLQLPRRPAEHRDDGRDDPVVRRDRDEHGLGVPAEDRRRLHAARRRTPGAHGRDRASRDPHGDRQPDARREGATSGYGMPGNTIIPPVSVAGARWNPTGKRSDRVGHRRARTSCSTTPGTRTATATASARCRVATASRSSSATS